MTNKRIRTAIAFIFLFSFHAHGESFRTIIAGIHRVSVSDPVGITVPLSYSGSSLIELVGDMRFFRGLQLELSVPQIFLPYQGSLAVVLYGELNMTPATGTVDLECSRLAFDIIPAKIQTTYQIPLREEHGFRTSPYTKVLTDVIKQSSFPLLFRLMPVIKGISDEMETMVFNLNVRAIQSNEGALRIGIRYPGNLPGKPFTVLIDDEVISNPEEERLLKEGEHHLMILSEDYRNQSSRFVVERAKILDLNVELQDPTPLLVFEYPENARVYLDNLLVSDPKVPCPVEPGVHEVRFEVSDYSIMRSVTVQKGKTYRVALSVDMVVTESE